MSSDGPTRTRIAASLTDVTLRYGSGTQALDGLTLEVRDGEHLCVLGSNGSGKSTLASVLCGLLAPDAGRVELLGMPVFDSARDPRIDFDAYRRARRSLGLVFQNPDDQIVTTVVEEDVAFGPENLGVEPARIGELVERELRRVAMTDFAKADPTRLSGGQKQRVTIAGALAMEPRLIVFDEPGSLLDVRGRGAILRVMRRLADEGTTVVHITHFMEEALVADRVVVLDHGRIALEGTPAEVFERDRRIRELGLEEPFGARLAHALGLPWTCDDDALARAIARGGVRVSGADGDARADALVTEPAPPAAFVTEPARAERGTAAQASHVSFSYRASRKALDDVSLVVDPGSSVAIVGHTGSGKSTLLRLLCALEVPDEGEVRIGGIPTRRKRDRRRLHGTIGYVMQHPERQLFANTVMEDVAFGPQNMGLSAAEVAAQCRRALDLVGLVGHDDASPFELSGGQQRLCAIAGILAMDPRILVLDEPTAGLDPRGRRELRRILRSIHKRGVTIVQVTHSMEDAVRCERVLVLDQARVMIEGTPAEVFCPQHAEALVRAGLGLPQPLAWALRLEREGLGPLGDPLTLRGLVDAVADAARGREG